MNGIRGRKEPAGLEGLGYLVPPGSVTEASVAAGLRQAMEQRRFLAGHGVPSVPTRYVVSLHPSDRVALHPRTEDRLARMLTAHAERAGDVIIGDLQVEFEPNRDAAPGRPLFWAGFADDDLLVLSSPGAAVTAFTRT